jgi:chaperonin GroES
MKLDVKLNINKMLNSPNIVDMLDESCLNTIGHNVITEFLLDKESRSQWEKRVEEAMMLALQVAETKSFPWSNASNIKFPLVTIAALQFHSRAYPALIPTQDIIKIDCEADPQTPPEEQAKYVARDKRVERHMSYQILKEDENWEAEMDKVLITVPIVGCAFKKTYWNFNEDHPVSENILAKDFVVSYWTKNLKDSPRQSHVLYLSSNDIISRQRRGIWCDFKLNPVETLPSDNLTAAQDKAQGTNQPNNDPATPYEFIEQHRWEDLDGDGFAEPYIITVHRQTGQVVRIVANYFESSIKRNSKEEIINIKPESYFTKYPFIPSPDGGFYDIGFGILLGPLNESINTIINQLVDAGTMANTAGGFLSRGIKIRGGNYNFAPLEWKHVDSTGEDLAKGIYPLPVREPSQVLFTLLTTLVNYGERIIGATDIMVGENVGQNTPATTSQAMTEQGMKVFAGIFKRIYRSLNEEFRKVYRLNQLYLPDQYSFGGGGKVYAADYQNAPTDLRPSADPYIVSDTQRVMQAETLRAAAMSTPGFNTYKVMVRYLEALKIPNIEEILPDPSGPNAIQSGPSEKIQIEQMKAQERQLSVQIKFKLGVMKLAAEAEINRAKITKLEAEAVYILKETSGVEQNQKVALINARIGALKAHQEGILRSIDTMMKATELTGEAEYGADARGVLGLAGESSDQSPQESPDQGQGVLEGNVV